MAAIVPADSSFTLTINKNRKPSFMWQPAAGIYAIVYSKMDGEGSRYADVSVFHCSSPVLISIFMLSYGLGRKGLLRCPLIEAPLTSACDVAFSYFNMKYDASTYAGIIKC